jgi:hypothetical chaperone protein
MNNSVIGIDFTLRTALRLPSIWRDSTRLNSSWSRLQPPTITNPLSIMMNSSLKEDLGYHLHQAVQRVKCELSKSDVSTFRFSDWSIDLAATLRRPAFEGWISDELERIRNCVDSLLANSGVRPREIDRVFLAGGTSFVPAVKKIFEKRFGAERIRTGNEFTSVARGLSLKALEISLL